VTLHLDFHVQVPVVSTEVGRNENDKGKALNKIQWDKDGRRAAIGSSDGHVHVYDIGDMSMPRSEEWNALQRTVADMIANSENESGRYSAVYSK
jgi:dynein intermediate chain